MKYQIERLHIEIRMKLRTFAALNAVIRPQNLLESVYIDRLSGLLTLVSRGEGYMSLGMPVLRCHHKRKRMRQFVDHRDNPIPLRHLQTAAGTEIVLDVNDEKC